MSISSRKRHRRGAVATALLAGGAAALAVVGVAGPAAAADDGYFEPTTTEAACHVYSNYPKAGVQDYGWDVGAQARINKRYAFDGYIVVEDPARSSLPLHWGFIAAGCLTDARILDSNGNPLGDLRAPRTTSDPTTVSVDIAPAPGTQNDLIHVTSAGTLRSSPQSFAIGNVRVGDSFYLTTQYCQASSPDSWVFGRDTNSGRWGYVQAGHFSACTG